MITSLLIIANFLFANNEIYHHVPREKGLLPDENQGG